MSLIMPNGGRTIPYGGDWMKGQPSPQQPQQGFPQRPTIQRPGQAQPQYDPYGSAVPYGAQKPQATGPQWNQGGTNQQQTRQQPFQQYMAQGSPYGGANQFQQRPQVDPNVANNPYANRPAPFQATTQNFDGTQSQMPNFQQRDAFIGQINNQLGQMQSQSWQQPGMGAPQFNFPQMWGQAGEMAQQGYQNPFAQAGQGLLGTLRQQSTPSMYSPQPSVAPQQGGISAQQLGIGPSVTYAQPGGGWGHTPTAPQQGAAGQPQPAGPVSPGTAQPIQPQSQVTPPTKARPQASDLDALYERRAQLIKQGQAAGAEKWPGQEIQAINDEITRHPAWQQRQQEDKDLMRILQLQGLPVEQSSAYADYIGGVPRSTIDDVRRRMRSGEISLGGVIDERRRQSSGVASQMAAANKTSPQPAGPAKSDMNSYYRDDGSYDYGAAQRDWQAKYNAQKRQYMKQPVAKRNSIYGSDANRRAYEIWMR